MRRLGMSRSNACLVALLLGACAVDASDGDGDADVQADGDGDADADAGADGDGDTDADADVEAQPDASDAGDGDEEPPPEPGAPLFDASATYATTIAASGDPADVYYPAPADLAPGVYAFPVAVLLQGAKVDKEHYAGFAATVARYGFVVVVPNHLSTTLLGTGLYAEQSEPAEVLAHLRAENDDSASPVHGIVDTSTLVLLGHSYGGVAGLNVIRDVCQPPSCSGGFDRPAELAGGVFYGTNLVTPIVGGVPDIDNHGLPVALVQGSLDSKARPAQAEATYDKIQHPPKALITLLGANHYGICDSNNPPDAARDGTEPTLDQEVSVETTARWTAIFLRARVLGDADAVAYLETTGDPADVNVEVTQAW